MCSPAGDADRYTNTQTEVCSIYFLFARFRSRTEDGEICFEGGWGDMKGFYKEVNTLEGFEKTVINSSS